MTRAGTGEDCTEWLQGRKNKWRLHTGRQIDSCSRKDGAGQHESSLYYLKQYTLLETSFPELCNYIWLLTTVLVKTTFQKGERRWREREKVGGGRKRDTDREINREREPIFSQFDPVLPYSSYQSIWEFEANFKALSWYK